MTITGYIPWKSYYQNIVVICIGTILFGRFFGNRRFTKNTYELDENRKSKRGWGVRPAYPTPMHYSGSLKIATYMRGRGEENMMKHSKLSNFHGFWAFQFLMTIPKKLDGFDHNW